MSEPTSGLPLTFEVNRGQAPDGWDFLVRCRAYHAFVRSDEVMFSFDGAALSMSLADADRVAPATRGLELPGRVNYFLGNDPSKWISNAPTTRGVRYDGVAAGTAWSLGGRGRLLEFAFDLAPGLDRALLRFSGARSIRTADDGSLVISMPAGEARISRPVAWQETPAGRVDAAARFVVEGEGAVCVRLAPRDPNRATHVDPTVSYASYLGASGSEMPGGAAMDSTGAAFYAAHTTAANFPTTAGAYDVLLGTTGAAGTNDIVLAKLNPAGSALVYSTYIGGNVAETIRGLAIDSAGNAFVVGETTGNDYPVTAGAYGATAPSTYSTGAGVLTELNSSGSALVYSTYTMSKTTAGVAVGPSGSVYIAEGTGISRYSSGGTTQVFHRPICPATTSGLLVRAVASDSSGNGYVTGETGLTTYPVPTLGAYQQTLKGNWDAFVVKVTPAGVVVYSTYLGGTGNEYGHGIDVNAHGDAYVVGEGGSGFPVTAGAWRTIPSSGDGFLARLQPDGSGLRYATGLGGPLGCETVRVHPCGSCVLGGRVALNVFPTLNAFQTVIGGGNADGYVMKFNADNTLAWASFCGGNQDETLTSIGMGPDGSVAVEGNTGSSNFPTLNAFQTLRSGTDLFIVKIPDTLPTSITPPTIGAMTMPPWTLGRPYSKQVTPLGSLGPYVFTVTTLPLPPGLSLSPSGLLAGTPGVIGTHQFGVHVLDVCDLTADGTIRIVISLPPTIASPALRGWTRDIPCDLQIATADGTAPFDFAITAGATPAGLTLTQDGHLTGTPTQLGDTHFTVRATDVAGADVTQDVTFRVNPAPSISTADVPPCSESFLYDFFFQTSGGTAPFTWSIVAGTPPSAAGINATNGSLTGAARAAGGYDFTVRATDVAGVVAEKAFHANVNPKLVVTTTSLAPGAVGRPYSAQLDVTGGGPPLVWGLRAGQFPAGMQLDASTGLLHGTPQEGHAGGLDFTCSDACGSVVRTLVLDVAGVVDLASRKAGETIEFGGILPTTAPRALELTGGTLLSITLKGGSRDDVLAQIVVTDAAGTAVDLTQWTRTSKKSVAVKGWPVPSSGRWFVSARVAPQFVGKAKLSFAITPRAAWPGGAAVGPGTAEFTFSAPPGAAFSITAKIASGTAAPKIVSVRGPDGADLFAAGTYRESAKTAAFVASAQAAGGDYRVTFASRDGSAGTLAWTVKVKLPKLFSFALPDVPAGD